MPDTLLPTTAADNPTLVPPDPDEAASSWLPAPFYWNAAPTMLLPPAKPAPPVPIPEGVFLIPTDMLPPPMLDVAPREPSSIPPPAMVGPIDIARVSEAVPESEPPSVCPEPPASMASPASLPLAEYPPERCASIAACVALRPTECSTILDKHQLDAATWNALERHWTTAIKTALNEGDATLLRAYDAAYVSSLEQRRGSITADEHARLVSAKRSGRSAGVLRALGLPPIAMLPIERVLLQRRCSVV